MGIDENKIFSDEYDSDSTIGSPINIVKENDLIYEISSNEEDTTKYIISKPIRIIIKATII